jgi:pimeloyl-ACP methyl ester carboxylesterase
VIVGHDWGAPVAWHCALLRPDIFRVLSLLSVPYLQRSWTDPRPTVGMKHLEGDQFHFYQSYFQEPGKAEAEFEADIRKSLLAFLYAASGDPPPAQRWRFLFKKSETLMDSVTVPAVLPSWLTEQDVSFRAEFTCSCRGTNCIATSIVWEFSAPCAARRFSTDAFWR